MSTCEIGVQLVARTLMLVRRYATTVLLADRLRPEQILPFEIALAAMSFQIDLRYLP